MRDQQKSYKTREYITKNIINKISCTHRYTSGPCISVHNHEMSTCISTNFYDIFVASELAQPHQKEEWCINSAFEHAAQFSIIAEQ